MYLECFYQALFFYEIGQNIFRRSLNTSELHDGFFPRTYLGNNKTSPKISKCSDSTNFYFFKSLLEIYDTTAKASGQFHFY